MNLGLAEIGAIFAVGAFWWQIHTYIQQKILESNLDEYEKYHRTISRIFRSSNGEVKLDEQIAAVFELRHFPRYFDVSERILINLANDKRYQKFPRLAEEAKFALLFISEKSQSAENRFKKFRN